MNDARIIVIMAVFREKFPFHITFSINLNFNIISYQNYFKYQSSNNSLSVFNLNKLDQLIKRSNASRSCVASLRRLVIESNQFEYWAIASESMLINVNCFNNYLLINY